jgi:oligoendopeptidase F
MALLKNGFNQSPAELLHQFLDIDLSGPTLLNDDLTLLNRRLDQLGVDKPDPAPAAK